MPEKKENMTTKKIEKKTVAEKVSIKKPRVKAVKKAVAKTAKPPASRLASIRRSGQGGEVKSATEKTEPVIQVKPSVKKKELIYQGVGRRKTAIARVRLTVNPQLKEKTFTVNGRNVEEYFSLPQYKKFFTEPLRTTNTLNRFDISVKIAGGGIPSQLGAMIHGLSRALVEVDPERFKKILRKRGFMTRDPRAKERKKVGLMGARKVKQSPKR